MFLPTSKKEITQLGWKQLDVIIVTGDAYIDHPAFGAAIIGRYLLSKGFKVGIIAQPDWKKDQDFLALGEPRLFFGITAGNMDSMVNHYTARKKIRSNDAYSPQDKAGLRPNRASIVYSNKIKKLFKNVPVVLGGVEASLRRIPHYDYWSNKVRNSILFDSKADLLVYGMGERPILQVALALEAGEIPQNIAGTTVISKQIASEPYHLLPEFHSKFSKQEFWQLNKEFLQNYRDKDLYMLFAGRYLKHNKPAEPLSTNEMDEIYNLEFERDLHPQYKNKRITAFEQIKTSVTAHRGCFGGCNFCAIGQHQGKTISSRSEKSILTEVDKITNQKYFHKNISDIGGPTANMYGTYCKLGISRTCTRNSCLMPDICPHLQTSQTSYKKLLTKVRKKEKVQNVFIGSGIRFDLALQDQDFIRQIAKNHTSGLLKLAPEHTNDRVLQKMNKPKFKYYQQFLEQYMKYSRQFGKKQFVVPYIIVGHPGETLQDTIELAYYLKKNNIRLKQIQQFTPTPMTISTLMYYTGKDLQNRKIYVPNGREIRLMKALVQWYKTKNRKLIREALQKAGRNDLTKFFLG
jgi:uncharacterized radical SAM protein YgiQ